MLERAVDLEAELRDPAQADARAQLALYGIDGDPALHRVCAPRPVHGKSWRVAAGHCVGQPPVPFGTAHGSGGGGSPGLSIANCAR